MYRRYSLSKSELGRHLREDDYKSIYWHYPNTGAETESYYWKCSFRAESPSTSFRGGEARSIADVSLRSSALVISCCVIESNLTGP